MSAGAPRTGAAGRRPPARSSTRRGRVKPAPGGSLGKRARRSVRKDAEARRRRTAATAAGLPSKRGPSAADPAWNRQRANLCVSASPRESFLIFPPLFVPLRANTFRLGFRLAARGGELGAGELARRIGIGPREFLRSEEHTSELQSL